MPGKRRIVGVGNIVDEQEYDNVDEIPPFSVGIEPFQTDMDNEDDTYLRSDHQEGTWENTPKKKNRRKSPTSLFVVFFFSFLFFFNLI